MSGQRPSLYVLTAFAATVMAVAVSAQRAGAPASVHIVQLAYADARPAILADEERLPSAVKGKSDADREAAWPAWVSQHNSEIRARLQRGDEDSLVNFWMYGTSFTKLPRATERELAQLDRGRIAELLEGRLDDLVSALANPGANDRLRFARQVIEHHGINPGTPAGQDQARAYLIDVRSRVISDNERYKRAAQSAAGRNQDTDKLTAFSTMFSDRGLSSDTSLRPGFAIETTLSAMKASGRLGEVHRLGIVGPGLDFSDKAEGYDFYPQQTIQPFGIIDSLIRLGMARAGGLSVTTFDLSPRVNQHVDAARRRAQAGQPYVLQLPLDMKDPAHDWSTDLVSYWRQLGDRIGVSVPVLPRRAALKAFRSAPSVCGRPSSTRFSRATSTSSWSGPMMNRSI